jgi:hypothetical protein
MNQLFYGDNLPVLRERLAAEADINPDQGDATSPQSATVAAYLLKGRRLPADVRKSRRHVDLNGAGRHVTLGMQPQPPLRSAQLPTPSSINFHERQHAPSHRARFSGNAHSPR